MREVSSSQDTVLWGYCGSSCFHGEGYRGYPTTTELGEGRSDPDWCG